MILTDIYDFLRAEGNVKESILVKKPWITYCILVTYVLLVKWIIPLSMRNRRPLSLRKIVITYNLMLSLLNATATFYLFSYLRDVWKYRCVVHSGPRHLYQLYAPIGLRLIYYAWLLKYVELLDTILFALRKKDANITFLHLFHHTLVILFFLGGFSLMRVAFYFAFAVAINLAVHVIMYLYYGLAAVGPRVQKYLWWKKYLTLIQIGQFIMMLLYGVIGLFTGCEEFEVFEVLFFLFVAAVLGLFINFYLKSYRQKNLKSKDIKEK